MMEPNTWSLLDSFGQSACWFLCLLWAQLKDLLWVPVYLFLKCIPVWKWDLNPKSIDPTSKEPFLILVHGSSANQSEFLLARCYLKWLGWNRIYSLNLEDSAATGHSIEQYAVGVLLPFLIQLSDQYHQVGGQGPLPVILIGHSMGGLVSEVVRQVLTQPDSNRDLISIQGMVTLGTPWRGAPALRLIPESHLSARHRQMAPHSAFIQCMKTQLTVPVLCVTSQSDLHVPGQAALHTSAQEKHPLVTEYAANYHGHFGMVCSIQVWKQIHSWIARTLYPRAFLFGS